MESKSLRIPSINFNDLDPKQPNGFNWDKTRIEVFSALETYGCFDAVYNRVGSDLKEILFGYVMPKMFGLPLERKQMNGSNNFLGYVGKITDLEYESFRLDDTDDPLFVDEFAQLLHPERKQLFSDPISSFAQSVRCIEQMVEKMIFQSLGIEKYCDSHLESLIYTARFAKYGDIQGNEARVALPTHRDPNLITIICQNQVEGLEVLNKDEEWIRVVPSPNSFTVIVGESLTVLTNGRLKALVHRVSVDQKRYSIMLGSLPKKGYIIEVPKEIIDEDHPLKYSSFDVYKYLEFYLSREAYQVKDSLKAFYGV